LLQLPYRVAHANEMSETSPSAEQRVGALALIRALRALDQGIGVRHSGIALDIGLLLYEREGAPLTVKEICALTRYSGPTVRLVMARLVKAGMVRLVPHGGRTTAYALTTQGVEGFHAYVGQIWDFGIAVARGDVDAFIEAAREVTVPDRPAGRRPLRGRYEDAQPDREAAD
jgi:hypothetical protein